MTTPILADFNNPFSNSLTGPSDGETGDASDVNGPFQNLLDTVNRVGRRTIADFTQLRAQTGMLDGERYYVRDFGLYEWQASSVVAELVPWIIDPTVAGTGRFHLALEQFYPHLGRKQIAAFQVAPGGVFSTASAVFVDVDPGATISFTGLITGDIVEFQTHFMFNAPAGLAEVRVAKRENADAFVQSNTTLWISDGGGVDLNTWAAWGRHIMIASGTFDAKLQYRLSAGAGSAQIVGAGAFHGHYASP